MLLPIFCFLLLILYAALFLFFHRAWQQLKPFEAPQKEVLPFISLIIPARNEAQRIGQLLYRLSQQTLAAKQFEIIVVDDHSSDDTAAVATSAQLSNLSVIRPQVPEGASSKKKAIEAGIAAAKGEWIITTDADCLPPPQWLQTLAQFASSGKVVFIAAPVRFTPDGSLLQVFQTLDFLMLQGITAASVASQSLTMCNGANLAYRRQAFLDAGGFSGIDKVATGDDMLLMYKIWKRAPQGVHYLKSFEAIVDTPPVNSWKDFWMQRKRWGSKTLVYDDKRVLAVLALVLLVNLAPLALLVASLVGSLHWSVSLLFILGKALIEFAFLYRVAGFYRQRILLSWFFPLQPLHILYTVVVGIASSFGTYEWKGRRTR